MLMLIVESWRNWVWNLAPYAEGCAPRVYCRFDAIGQCIPLVQLANPMQKVFLLIAELLIRSILILFSFWRVE